MITISDFIYRDPIYGFSLRIPSWWKPYIVVRRTTRTIDSEYGAFFLFKYKGKIYTDVLSLLVFRKSLKQWQDEGFDESPIIRLAVRNRRIFAYATPGELPHDFLNDTEMDYDYVKYGIPIRLLKRMVNDDVPKIVKTLRIDGK